MLNVDLKTTIKERLHWDIKKPPKIQIEICTSSLLAPPLQCYGFLGFLWLATNIVRWGRGGGGLKI